MLLLALLSAQLIYSSPQPPPLKSGTFSCHVFDRGGAQIALSGALGNSRRNEKGQELADIKVEAPKGSGLTFRTWVVMKPLQVDFRAYDEASKTLVSGTLDVREGPEGRIMLEHSVLEGSAHRTLYVGFCDTQFSTKSKEIPS